VENCCESKNERKESLKKGILYGLLPHSFCVAFVLLSVVGATIATTFFKGLLLLPYFFPILIGFSFLAATISGILYLKKQKKLNPEGIKQKWQYLSVLYGTTIVVNLLFFFVIFPLTANIETDRTKVMGNAGELGNLREMVLKVKIPCSGHAPLISGELKKITGVYSVTFSFPNKFLIKYNPNQISPDKIFSSEIFKSFPVTL